ncbi:hypothetical protein LCGC14_0799750 [marine sediment metagenome]|uniref:Uncharacterized protein n=1 Tax=marine sediment metagenome TaxID=412755 RepID=A0A0F9SA32_9ZZZZ
MSEQTIHQKIHGIMYLVTLLGEQVRKGHPACGELITPTELAKHKEKCNATLVRLAEDVDDLLNATDK